MGGRVFTYSIWVAKASSEFQCPGPVKLKTFAKAEVLGVETNTCGLIGWDLHAASLCELPCKRPHRDAHPQKKTGSTPHTPTKGRQTKQVPLVSLERYRVSVAIDLPDTSYILALRFRVHFGGRPFIHVRVPATRMGSSYSIPPPVMWVQAPVSPNPNFHLLKSTGKQNDPVVIDSLSNQPGENNI